MGSRIVGASTSVEGLGQRRALKAMGLFEIQMAWVRLAALVKHRERQRAGVEKPGG
jgi:hypothetical protein